MMYKLNDSLHALAHFISRRPASSTSKLWHSHAGSSQTRLFLTGALGSILVCAIVLLVGAARAQDPQPQALQGSGPAPNPEFGPNANLDLDKPHLLAGSYYSMRGGLKATLLLNNKGPRPLEVRPTLFSLAGERLDIQPVVVEGNSFRMIDLREWAMVGGFSFEQGSIQLFHPGRDLVLGAQIYLVDDVHSLSFDEKLTEITDGSPARLEGIWWLPSAGAEVLVTLSNTSDASLTVTTRLMNSGSNGTGSATLDLRPHETRVIDVSRDSQSSIGALSIEHSGTGGPLVARAMVQDPTTGYSSTVQFSAPQKGKSSRLEGVGLRLRGASGESLTPIVVARNVGDAAITLRGRVPYTTADGDVRFVKIGGIRLAPGEAKVIQLDRASEIDRIPPEVEISGLEFEHAGAPGSVIMAAHSMSRDGNQVYRVPMWDPLAQRSPTGGYPWYMEGTSSTTVYIKNITGREQKYMAHLIYPGGTYVFGLQTVKGGQTVEIDPRALRDNQVPDEEGRTIPLEVSRGQIKWSLKPVRKSSTDDPEESLALIGRSEQTDTVQGISSNYSCQSCCTDGFMFGQVSPNSVEMEFGQQVQLTAYETAQDCYGNIVTNQHSATWSSSNTSVASVSGGLVTANGTGNVSISAKWFVTQHFIDPSCGGGTFLATTGGDGRRDSVDSSGAQPGDEVTIMLPAPCENGCANLWFWNTSGASIVAKPKVTINSAQTVKDGTTVDFSVTVQGGTATAYLWTFEAPSGTGNNPNVPFSSTTIQNPTAKAHWFAKPDTECTAPCTSQYKIKCKVSYSGGSTTKETTLTVDGCWVPAGQVNPNNARVTGAPQMGPDANGVWRVTGMGNLARQVPTKEVFVPNVSQFFTKADAHEQEHLIHWSPGKLFGNVHQPADFFARIQNFTGASQQELLNKIVAEFQVYTAQQDAFVNANITQSEKLAHAVSDPMNPKYLYQNCGRF